MIELLFPCSRCCYDFRESRALWLLALMGWFVVGRTPVLGLEPCLTLAKVYTIPLTKPTAIAETLGTVTGASKNTSPLSAMGSLLRAPTMEYVVEEVTRTHHAEVYEMKTDDRPEKIIAKVRLLRRSAGKFELMFSDDQFSRKTEQTRRIGIERTLL